MAFTSLSYFIFLPVVFLAISVVGDRCRWVILLLSSYIFYGFLLQPALLVVLTVVILITHYLGRVLHESQDRSTRHGLLLLGIVANLSLLIYFKYLPFLARNLNSLLNLVGLNIALRVPPQLISVGLSFFIFQAISYLADIYFRIAKAELNLGYFALYMSYFPKLLQGPIERARVLIPQLKTPYELNYENVTSGLLLFAWGLFKKIVVADRLALYVNPVYNDVHAYPGLSLIIATYAYALQIYFDFAGYTDMARGTARMFGISLTENFNSPYLATSCTEYWRRWHISLSRWILDYIFEPLQMQFRKWGKVGTAAALVVTFLACGAWHGASWCYVIWGLLHGIYLAASTYYRPYQKKLHKWLRIEKSKWVTAWQVFVTFNLVSFAFIFFRAETVGDALYVVTHILDYVGVTLTNITKPGLGMAIALLGRENVDLAIDALIMCTLLVICIINKYNGGKEFVYRQPVWCRWSIYYALVLSIMFLGVYSHSSFIYFTF